MLTQRVGDNQTTAHRCVAFDLSPTWILSVKIGN